MASVTKYVQLCAVDGHIPNKGPRSLSPQESDGVLNWPHLSCSIASLYCIIQQGQKRSHCSPQTEQEADSAQHWAPSAIEYGAHAAGFPQLECPMTDNGTRGNSSPKTEQVDHTTLPSTEHHAWPPVHTEPCPTITSMHHYMRWLTLS